ncbi:MAG: hypothetical protein AABN95_08940 [Acidobacteriota bacterium]
MKRGLKQEYDPRNHTNAHEGHFVVVREISRIVLLTGAVARPLGRAFPILQL